MALKTTLDTSPLLAMMLHTGTKKNTTIEATKHLTDRCPLSLCSKQKVRVRDHV